MKLVHQERPRQIAGIGELCDRQDDPGQFDSLWDEKDARELKLDRLNVHVDALAGTVRAGPPRVVDY